jgi:hypothetical protein
MGPCALLAPKYYQTQYQKPKHLYVIDTKQMLGGLVMQLSRNDIMWLHLTQL